MPKPTVRLSELTMALTDADPFTNYYLDRETGAVVSISDERHRELEAIYEELDDAEAAAEGEPDLAAYLRASSRPQWEQDDLLRADEVDRFYLKRYVAVPQADSHEDYQDMADFASTVADGQLRQALWQALEGRRPFRRFKDVLAGERRVREQSTSPP